LVACRHCFERLKSERKLWNFMSVCRGRGCTRRFIDQMK
jgi:hypothetical protein